MTYLLFNLFRGYLEQQGVQDVHIIDIAFDSFENKKYRNPEILYPYLKAQIADKDMYYILLDEVQFLDDFESVLNSLARIRNVDLYVTGSNAKFLSKDIITEFRGRGDEIYMYPLTFSEFMSVYDGDKADGWRDYVLYGGLPLILHFETPDQKSDFLKLLFGKTYTLIVIRNSIPKISDLV